jgi:hypothetical protein
MRKSMMMDTTSSTDVRSIANPRPLDKSTVEESPACNDEANTRTMTEIHTTMVPAER